MKIVVTGALGHIGSRLIREIPFLIPECEIVLVDNFLTLRYCSLFDLPKEGRYRFIEGNILTANLEEIFSGAYAVIHLAAITDAASSFDKPEAVEEINFIGTKRVAEACAKVDCSLLFLSTTSVYGTQNETVDEDCSEEELKPQSPYAVSKLKAEKALAELKEKIDLQYVILRFGTIFGTSIGMRFHTAVNKFCWQACQGLPVTVWRTAMDQKRPYLDLSDATNAIIHVLNNNLFDANVYNVLTCNATVGEIVGVIRELVPDLKVNLVDERIMNQLSYNVLCEKFKSRGFVFRGEIEKSIGETISMLRNIRFGQ